MISGFRLEVDENCALLSHYIKRVLLIPYRRFGTSYRSHLQGLRNSTWDR